jgi:Spy/CpxP family protein refolding chaperone
VNAWKVIVSTLVIFIAGAVTGGLLVTNAMRGWHNNPSNNQFANPWQVRNKELLRRMDRELELTQEQHHHIETIISTSQERTKDLWKPIAPQMNREMQLVRKEIRDQLTPDQRGKFDTLLKLRTGLAQERRRAMTNSAPVAPANTDTNSVGTNTSTL